MEGISKTASKGRARNLTLTQGAAVFVIGMLATQANAGEVLRLKTGDIDTRSVQSEIRVLRKGKDTSRYYVVQFKSRITEEDRKNLASLGAKVVRYIPDDALVIEATSRAAKTISQSSTTVHAIAQFQADWKVSPDFQPASVFTRSRDEEVLIRLFPQQDGKAVARTVETIPGAKIVIESGRSIIARVQRGQIGELARIEGVEWIQPNPQMVPFHLMDEEFGSATPSATGDYSDITGFETGTKLMNFDPAWKKGFNGRGQIVAMADTGLDKGDIPTVHQDFNGRVPAGFIFGLFSKSWEDPMGHGTHVAGSVMGSGAASGGLLKGGAPGASLIPEGMWSPMLGNLSVPPKLRDLFDKPYQAGARIHTNSWGNPRALGTYDGFAQQVDEYMYSNPDMLVIFAAGNSGVDADKDGRIDPGSVSSPGTAKNVLTVGASKNYVMKGGIQKKLIELKLGQEAWGVEPLASSMLSENAQGLAPFSSRGPTQDGRIKPEVVAPGTNILSVKSQHPQAELLWGEYNKDYVWSGGTSMSTPLTAGAAAVVRQYLIEDRKIANPSAALLKAALMHTAVDLFPGQFGEVGKSRGQELLTQRPNIDEGYGRVDVARATDLGRALIIDERGGLKAGESHSYPLHVNGRSKLTATLVYTDAPAAASASKSLVNDLDLVVVDAAGKEKSLGDHINNSEMLELEVGAGDLEIKVKGTNVPQGVNGKQPYALILSVQ